MVRPILVFSLCSLILVSLGSYAYAQINLPTGHAQVIIKCRPLPTCKDQLDNQLFNETRIYHAVENWIENLSYKPDGAIYKYRYYIGKPKNDRFDTFPASRILIILPSEYVRDSGVDWDMFDLVVGYLSPITAQDPGPLWISTENYKQRRKGVLAPDQPSPDWEFNAVDNETATTRSQLIADAIKKASEEEAEIALAPPHAPGIKVPPRRKDDQDER